MTSAAPTTLTPRPYSEADTAVAGVLAALELRYPGAREHAERVTDLAVGLTRVLDPRLAAREGVRHAYLLHDIGKLGLPDAIILKPGRLTASELRLMRTHTMLGESMVQRLPVLSPLVRDVIASHHERWDGRGYPHGLGGWAIPLASRILAVADAFDAMTNVRPYRRAQPRKWALAELRRRAGAQFDPTVVDVFLQLQEAGLPTDDRVVGRGPLGDARHLGLTDASPAVRAPRGRRGRDT